MRGTGMEMYTECLSTAFVGLSFPAAAQYVPRQVLLKSTKYNMRITACSIFDMFDILR